MGFTYCHTPKSVMSLIEKQESGCWKWCGHIDKRYGYGRILYQGKRYQAHRLFYELFKGEIPETLIVRHTCDNKECVNPEHLLLGTSKDNSLDAVIRNRTYRPQGSKNIQAKLTESDVRQILWNLDGEDATYWAKKFNVSVSIIRRIWNRKIWRHV